MASSTNIANPFARSFPKAVTYFVVVAPAAGTFLALFLLLVDVITFEWFDGALLVGLYVSTMIGMAMGFHRLFSHQAFQANRMTKAVLIILGSMSAQGTMFYYAATHRRHHQHSDREGDAHSPHQKGATPLSGLRGFWHSHVGWILQEESINWSKNIPELIRDRWLFFFNKHYLYWVLLGLALPFLAGWMYYGNLIGGIQVFLWAGLVRIFLVHHGTWCINSLCHLHGAAPFNSRDRSKNNWFVALITLGEGWHNNHHAFPTTASNQFHWWQLDPTGWIIQLLSFVGLASRVQRPTKAQLESKLN